MLQESNGTPHSAADGRWFLIVNPVAGNGNGLNDFPKISKLLREYGIICDAAFTEHVGHATELTVEAVNGGYRKIIVVGGDGTLNEVVNGLFVQQCVPAHEVTLALISVGAENDWGRAYGLPQHYARSINAIREGHSFLQDIAAVTYTESMYSQTRYMVNAAGLGFEALVTAGYNHRRIKRKGKGVKARPIYSILRAYFGYKYSGIMMEADGKRVFNGLAFSIAAGNCKFSGMGIQQLPRAVMDDGLLDVTIIKPIHWWNILFRAGKLFNGRIYDIGHILHFRCRKLHITSSPDIPLETDGELHGETPVTIEAVPKAIRVIVTREFLEKA